MLNSLFAFIISAVSGFSFSDWQWWIMIICIGGLIINSIEPE